MPRESRTCLYCETITEDEYHFIMVCPLYSDIRLKYLHSFYYTEPSLYKFYRLIALQDERVLLCVFTMHSKKEIHFYQTFHNPFCNGLLKIIR